ncbi:hypothetical protein Pint_06059 [Pistacia integerrima]|uniref:Uncharacterized protein n=1 Tax=Pistacia integerrima TaxID=434235 RepID=A0ACC0Z2A9_9ROSI|nr:hypothetical protein Pint_06059 [Pistacia integerrima]
MIKCYSCGCQWNKQEHKLLISRKSYATKAIKLEQEEEPLKVVENKKKGTVAGAVALVIGTSIGSGILALPQKASPAGIVPSSISLIVCWGFLLIEALLLVEINVNLRRKMRKNEQENELEIISIRTMAQETLGDWGGILATITYVFLGYSSMIAYCSKSGEILFHLINLPESVSGFLFTALFTLLISIGGTRTTDRVNQWLTASMIGLLLAIEVVAVVLGGWSGLDGSGNWGKVPATIPVIIFSLVYHDLAPVLCAYLGGDLARLRVSVLLGSLVPLLALLIWDAIALGLSAQTNQVVDPVELLMSFFDPGITEAVEDRSRPVYTGWGGHTVITQKSQILEQLWFRQKWSGISFMVEAFSLLAVGTSIIGTLLAFSEFFKEQLQKLSWNSPSTQMSEESEEFSGLSNWWGRNKISFTAMAMVIAPTLFVSTTVPDVFSAATDIAGGYCMTMLFGVLPPAMAWAVHRQQPEDADREALSSVKPVVFGAGLLACCIVVEQILLDFSAFHP